VTLRLRDPVTRDPVILGYLDTWLPCDPVTRDPWRPEDPGIRVVGGTAYGRIYMCIHTWYGPTRADVNMARGGGDRELE